MCTNFLFTSEINAIYNTFESCFLYDTWISQGSFMRTKHLLVLINIRYKGEAGTIKLV